MSEVTGVSPEEMAERQYAKFGDLFVPVGSTVRRLAAGFYELGLAGFTHGLKPSKPVSDDLIEIPGTPADDVMEDINLFLQTKERYMRCGLTHKRGYLFYGPPGTGKTSLGLMIARRFIREADGVVLHVPGSGHLQHLAEILKDVEPGRPSMFLMEEADSFVNDTTALSILDGEQSLAGAVFVAMTNYKEKMPPRIANRPGRFDRVVYIGAPPYRVQVEYFRRLLNRLSDPSVPDEAATAMADALDGIQISMGHLREAFISHVLMGTPTATIRKRFEQMAKTDGEDPEAAQFVHDQGEEPEDGSYCYTCGSDDHEEDDCPTCEDCGEEHSGKCLPQ